MERNIIFCFSGTGNSLKAAQDIGAALENCAIVPMTQRYSIEGSHARIGFVYPVYFQGVPARARDFISALNISENQNAYFFAVATYGAVAGVSLSQVNALLQTHGVTLSYGANLQMFSNYVVMYAMSKKMTEATQKSDEKIKPVIMDIVNTQSRAIKRMNPLLYWYYNKRIQSVPLLDKNFSAGDRCNACGICEKICPVSNIGLIDGAPVWRHHCEQCVACIQYCPSQAIEYKDITKNRGRYHHPAISHNKMMDFYKKR